METQQDEPVENPRIELVNQKILLVSQIRNGMNWFYWIAGLTIINSIIVLFGGNFIFIVGLAVPQITNGIIQYLSKSTTDQFLGLVFPIIAFLIDAILAGLFIVFGILGNKRNRLVIIIALLVYGLDGLVLLFLSDWLGLVFHGLAIFFIWKGFQSIGKLMELEKNGIIPIPEKSTAKPVARAQ